MRKSPHVCVHTMYLIAITLLFLGANTGHHDKSDEIRKVAPIYYMERQLQHRLARAYMI
jgi:hypothetical protein